MSDQKNLTRITVQTTNFHDCEVYVSILYQKYVPTTITFVHSVVSWPAIEQHCVTIVQSRNGSTRSFKRTYEEWNKSIRFSKKILRNFFENGALTQVCLLKNYKTGYISVTSYRYGLNTRSRCPRSRAARKKILCTCNGSSAVIDDQMSSMGSGRKAAWSRLRFERKKIVRRLPQLGSDRIRVIVDNGLHNIVRHCGVERGLCPPTFVDTRASVRLQYDRKSKKKKITRSRCT